MDQFLYKLGLPAVEAHDVVKRELCVSINGADPVVHEILDVGLAAYELTFEQDQHVAIFLVDIDDAGNRSANGMVLDFVVIDTVPPPAPSAPVIMEVIEVAPAPVVEEPVVEEPVVEEPIVEEPIVEEPIAEEPVIIDEPVEEPVVEEPVVEEPVVEEPVIEEPVAEEPIVEEPVVVDPVAEEPAVEDVVAEEPIVADAGDMMAGDGPIADDDTVIV